METAKVLIHILVLFSNTGVLFSTVLLKKDGNPADEHCIMSFVIPRDKMKSSCDVEEKVNRRLNSMEMRLNVYRREVTVLQSMLQKERQLCHDKLQALENKMATYDSDSRYYNLERKLENLEIVLKKGSETVNIGEKNSSKMNNHAKSGNKKNDLNSDDESLTSVVKPIVISEIENYLDNFTKILDYRKRENVMENNEIINMLPRNDQSYTDEGNLQGNESKTREIIEELKNLQDKLNRTGDALVATVGSLLKNVTVRGEMVMVKLNNSESDSQNISVELNNTEMINQADKPRTEIPHKSEKVSSRFSASEGGDEPQDAPEQDNKETYITNLFTNELEDILRGEINDLLQSRIEEVISLMRKQSANLVDIVNQQGEEIEKVEESNEEKMKRLQDKLEGIRLEMSSVSSTVLELYGKMEKMQSLHVIVEELKKNMSAKAEASSQDIVTKVDEHGKKLRTLERLSGIYQQSLQHYRNESKAAYTEMQNKLRGIETTLAKDVSSDLFANITSRVDKDIQRFNTTLNSKVNSMEVAIRNLEDNSVLFQMDLKTLERQHKSKTGKLEEHYDTLKSRVDRINNQNRKMQDGVFDLRTTQREIQSQFNSTSMILESLKIEFKLSVTEAWVEYDFQYDTSHTECFGKQYIRRTKFKNGRLAGVVLCNNMRYKILLANSVTDRFANVGDVSGFGEDHCEFVGATISAPIRLSPPALSMKTEQGFARENWGQEPERKHLNFLRPSPAWYECGIYIP